MVAADGGAADPWSPVIQVHRFGHRLIIFAELPGVRKEHVTVEVRGDAIVILGRKGLGDGDRCCGRFYIPLPYGARPAEGISELRDELFQLSIPIAAAGSVASDDLYPSVE